MKFNSLLFIVSVISVQLACRSSAKIQKQPSGSLHHPGLLEQLMRERPKEFGDIIGGKDSLKIQIIYSQIDRDQQNSPSFKDYYFNVDEDKYYYPASTVKLPTALLALEKLNELNVKGLTSNSSMITEAAFSGQSPVYNNPNSVNGRPTMEEYIKKIFLVSDNDAFNRLYEFLGQQYINDQLHKKGYQKTDILHRLSIFLTEEENRHTNPVNFYGDSARMVYAQPMQYNQIPYPKRNDSVGNGFYSGGKLRNGPMNFSMKNRLPLDELHSMMRALLFPEAVKKKERFNLTQEQYRFVRQYLSEYPSESGIPGYDTANYWDAYGKFLYWGAQKGNLPRSMRSFSKEGDAYGFLIDAAYIVDFEKNIEFMLSAVIYCNADGVLNDDKYDYDSVGLPFLKNLGKLIYDYELKRPRTYQPDLSTFRLDYKN